MNLELLKNKLKNTEELFKKDLSSLRVGRATPAIVENILVDYYGTPTPLKQIASISAPEPKSLVIDPWDKNAIPNIEKAIFTSDLGLSPIVDKNTIRINVPALTEERRQALIKIAGTKLEETKIKCRTIRDEAIKELTDLLSAKKITEDEKFKSKERVQELINEANRNLESALGSKEKEIQGG